MDAASELSWLTAAMCGGTLTLADRDRLERLLEDPANRRAYAAITEVHAGLQWRFRGELRDAEAVSGAAAPGTAGGESAAGHRDPAAGRHAAFAPLGARARRWLAGAFGPLLRPVPFSMLLSAALIAFGLTTAAYVSLRPADDFNAERAGGPVVAYVVRLHEARWREPARMPDLEAGITSGTRLDLVGGLVELMLVGGGRIILQGPALAEVPDGSTVHLERGLMHARFDAANGRRAEELEVPTLEVRTPAATFTDLGTEFGVGVADDGTSQVHVFEGLVELTPRVRDVSLVPPRLGANEARQVDRQGRISPAGFDLAKRLVRKIPGREPPPDWVEDRAVTLLYERFDEAGPIAGKAAMLRHGDREPQAVPWQTSSQGWVMTDAALLAPANGGVAAVPFVPEPGAVYRLSVTMDVSGSSGWAAIGFLPDRAKNFNAHRGEYAWMGQRAARSSELGDNFACGGDSMTRKISNVDQRYGRRVRTVQLDTRGRLWRAKFFVDGDEVAWYVFTAKTPSIRALAVGSTSGVRAEFRDLRLAVYRPDAHDETPGE